MRLRQRIDALEARVVPIWPLRVFGVLSHEADGRDARDLVRQVYGVEATARDLIVHRVILPVGARRPPIARVL